MPDAPPPRHQQVEKIADEWLDALQLGQAPSRAEVTAMYPELAPDLDRRLRLIEAIHRGGLPLQMPAGDRDTSTGDPETPHRESDEDLVGQVFDGYRVIEQIGEGGFGEVWRVQQETPVRRPAALKVLKPGMSSAAIHHRFEAERQALARMDHPGIATVFDAGRTPSGRAYFVMELVEGLPIMEFCDRERLGLSERLGLFREVCLAIQHAHQKGVIHRDIKASNVLVSRTDDGRVQATVIDFGIAKAIGGRLTDETLETSPHQIVGTLGYMSPEQLEQSEADLDTRSDVYSLGVLLYELTTGSLPLDSSKLRRLPLHGAIDLARKFRPPSPSLRLARLENSEHIAARRSTDIRSLRRACTRGLDWIVLRCLERDRQRRYDGAGELARDVDRWLRDEPVAAGPPSRLYLLRTFTRRHRVAVIAICCAVLALVAGIVGTTWALVEALHQAELAQEETDRANSATELSRGNERRAQRETARALLAEEQARKNASAAEAAAEKARIAARKAEAAAAFFQVTLLRSSPLHASEETTLLQFLDDAAAGVDERLADEPEVAATMHATIARAYLKLGRLAEAEHHSHRAIERREEALPADHADLMRDWSNLVFVLMRSHQQDRARELLNEQLARLPADHASLDIRQELMLRQGELDLDLGLLKQALETFDSILEQAPKDTAEWNENELTARNDRAVALLRLKRYADAEHDLRALRNIYKSRLGTRSIAYLQIVHNTVTVLRKQGKLDEAASLSEELIETLRNIWNEHPRLASALNGLATLQRSQGRLREAAESYRESLAMYRSFRFENRPRIAALASNLGSLLTELGELAEARTLLEESEKIRRDLYGASHADTAVSRNFLVQLRTLQGEHEQAKQDALSLLADLESAPRPSGEMLGNCHLMLGDIHLRLGEDEEAIAAHRMALRIFSGSPDPTDRLSAELSLGRTLVSVGRAAGALEVCESAAERAARERPGGSLEGHALALLGTALLDLPAKETKAGPTLQRGLAILQTQAGVSPWRLSRARRALARWQTERGDTEAAEALLRQSLEAPQEARIWTEWKERRELLDQLARLLESTDRSSEARELRETLEATGAFAPEGTATPTSELREEG